MQNGKWKEFICWDATITDIFGNIIEEHIFTSHTVWAVSPKQAAFKYCMLYKANHPMVVTAKMNEKYIEEIA